MENNNVTKLFDNGMRKHDDNFPDIYLHSEIDIKNIRILSQPESIRLRILEKKCGREQHKLKYIRFFSLEDSLCPIHNTRLSKDVISATNMEVIGLITETEANKKLHIFINPRGREIDNWLDIYQKINIKKGYLVNVSTKNKDLYETGILIDGFDNIEKFEDTKPKGITLMTKEQLINNLFSEYPRVNYSDFEWNSYKKAWVLPLVKLGYNSLIVGEPGLVKTLMGQMVAEIGNGAYGDLINTTRAGLIGATVQGFANKYVFQAGKIFDAKGKVLVLDEIFQGSDKKFLNTLNNIRANHTFSYNMAGIKYDKKDFWMSFIAMCNPSSLDKKFHDIPIREIERMFSGDFLSRFHMIIPIKDKGIALPKTKEKTNIEGIKVYVNQAKNIVMKETSEDVSIEIASFTEEAYSKSKNARFPRNFEDTCDAVARLNLHNQIGHSDFAEARDMYQTFEKMLYQ